MTGTLHDPFSQGQHQCRTLRREKGWCVAEVMVQQGSSGTAGLRWCQWGLGAARVCPAEGITGTAPHLFLGVRTGAGVLQGSAVLEGRVGWRSGIGETEARGGLG